MIDELIDRLGEGTTVASRVNGEPGLWIGFTIESDNYWLLLDRTRFTPAGRPHLADLAGHGDGACRWPARR